mgnify:CR=1 FL=1
MSTALGSQPSRRSNWTSMLARLRASPSASALRGGVYISRVRVQAARLATLQPVWRYPTALPCALGLLLVLLLANSPALPHWARFMLGG